MVIARFYILPAGSNRLDILSFQNTFQQTLGGIRDHIQRLIKPLLPAIVRIRYIQIGKTPTETQEQTDFVVMPDIGTPDKIVQILAIHCQNIVETFKIAILDLPASQRADITAITQRCTLSAQIRRIADVVIVSPCRIDQNLRTGSRFLDRFSENAFGYR
jgi:hypothetical protein